MISTFSLANTDVVVDENTPDSVLLEGKDVDAMAKVIEPSTTLTMTIAGVEKEIEVTSKDGETQLVVEGLTSKDAKLVKETFEKAVGKGGTDLTLVEKVADPQ